MQAAGEKLAIARRLCGPRGRGPRAPERPWLTPS